jgi:hypothetical protein
MLITREINSPLVQNFFIKHYTTGIINVTFNTHCRWICFHCESDSIYKFWICDDLNEEENSEEETIAIEDIQKIDNKSYIRTQIQNKDQISFYYIPYDLLDIQRK